MALIARKTLSYAACLELLCTAFPGFAPNNRPQVLGSADAVQYFVLGHFHHAPRQGVTSLTRKLPSVVCFLNAWLVSLFPGQCWSSIAVSHNHVAEMHADAANLPGSSNCTVSLGSFKGGGLWLADEKGDCEMRDPEGRPVLGRVHSTFQQPFTFDAQCLHATQPFQGERWAVTAYTTLHVSQDSASVREELLALGFPLPCSSGVGVGDRVVRLGPDPPGFPRTPSPPVAPTRVVQCSTSAVAQPTAAPRQVLDAGPHAEDFSCAAVAQRLKAARPVVWKGAGDLLQVPWSKAPHGKWLVLDLWSGFGGLCIACLSLGMHFWALAAECDKDAVSCARSTMPSIVHLPRVEDVSIAMLLPFLERRQVRGILIGGGSPCQGNSVLNKRRQGLDDPRSQQPVVLKELVDSLRQHPACKGLEIITFLENVASAPADVITSYSKWLHGPPVRINASSCGWCNRDRLFWLVGNSRHLGSFQGPLPDGWGWDTSLSSPRQLRYEGEKPVPPKIHCEQGFQVVSDPLMVMKQKAPAIFTFTREFYHPMDGVQQASPQAVERWSSDSRRFPPSAYEEHSLVWRGQTWRTPAPSERSQMLGVPPSATAAVPCVAAQRTQRRNSLLGNGFHIPSLLCVLSLLPSLCDAKCHALPTSLQCPTLQVLGERLQGTLWEPGRLQSLPCTMSTPVIVTGMQAQLSDFQVDASVWSRCTRALLHCDTAALQGFAAFQMSRGEEYRELPPCAIGARQRSQIYAGLSGQRFSSESARGLDHLLQPGLGKELHMLQSSALPSPFLTRDWPDADVEFVAYTIGVWREHLPLLAKRQRQIVRSVVQAVSPLQEALCRFRCESATRVAANKNSAVIAFFTSLLRWPDVWQAKEMIQGFSIVGEVPVSGLFRAITPHLSKDPDTQKWLAEDAVAAVDAIMQSSPGRHAAEIQRVTEKEQAKGFCSAWLTRSQLDARFGRGGWRPLERFLIEQADGKLRVIDNARRTGHNVHTEMNETIHVVSVEFVAAAAQQVANHLPRHERPPQEASSWLRMRLATDDLPDAYRGHPVRDDQLCFSIVAVFVEGAGWRFTILYGLAFGLESAVVNFNRFPLLAVAVCRRCLSGMNAAYFDDELSVDFHSESAVSQLALKLVCKAFGAEPQAAKSFPPAPDRNYLGTSVHVGAFLCEGTICVQPKFATVVKVCTRLQAALHSGTLPRDLAGRLRGDLIWLFSVNSGYGAKYAGPLLTRFQHGDNDALSAEDRLVLQSLLAIVLQAPPRMFCLQDCARPFTRVYSDASFEGGVLRLGWVAFPSDGAQPQGGTCLVPSAVLESWKSRRQQIYPGETLAVLLVPMLLPQYFVAADVLWFIDNQASVTAVIKGCSAEGDVHEIAHLAAVSRCAQRTKVWFEWIDSDSNPSDGLSRLGLQDPWSKQQGWFLQEFSYPAEAFRPAVVQALLSCADLETVGVRHSETMGVFDPFRDL